MTQTKQKNTQKIKSLLLFEYRDIGENEGRYTTKPIELANH